MKKKVISRNCLPTRFPFMFTAVVYLLMDKFGAPGWLWGVVGSLLALCWIGSIHEFVTQTQVQIDLNKED